MRNKQRAGNCRCYLAALTTPCSGFGGNNCRIGRARQPDDSGRYRMGRLRDSWKFTVDQNHFMDAHIYLCMGMRQRKEELSYWQRKFIGQFQACSITPLFLSGGCNLTDSPITSSVAELEPAARFREGHQSKWHSILTHKCNRALIRRYKMKITCLHNFVLCLTNNCP